MCGICGEFKFNKSQFDDVKLTKLMDSIANRGNDTKGTYKEKNIFLGHHRLSIIDTSDKSNQPMRINDFVIVFNGVIYNYKSLRRNLITKGHIFNSSGDTEVIIRLYIEHGNECVNYLDGVFSFAIYDIKKNNLFLARDRIGIKPLYYTLNNNEFRFSSSMNGLINKNEKPKINPIALHYQFTLHSVVPAPHTIISGIHKLEPGHTLKIKQSGESYLNKYFDINEVEIKDYKEQEIIEGSTYLLKKAVEKRVNIADVPVGILLSGGLDSSLITALAKKFKEQIDTYSIGFNTVNEEVGNEFYYSDLVAKDFKTSHIKYKINDDELFDNLDLVISNMSEPMFSQDSSAFFLLSNRVSKNNKVVLSGQGADEVFGGYFWYEQIMNEKSLDEIDTLSKYYFDRSFHNYKNIINDKYVDSNYVHDDISRAMNEMNPSLSTLDKVFRLELSMFIIDDPVKRVDNMTMSHALEARVPFLDIDLITYMLSIKGSDKIKHTSKYYLKKLSESFLKKEIIYRDKFYFPVPPLKIIEGKFYHYCKNVLNTDAALNRDIYNRKYIDRLLDEPNTNYTNLNGNELWHFTLLERWLQLNVDV
ncbi:MAG: N-acetylglutaminylglutamine amidotransferase [Gammaproteobacteria bacterium]|nr:N-acetylglutaminylglutamine amidotransferase [Gammaproteobacteria bacterium]MBL6818822.1 N-acetylglutaminylglutamine amidotransferase [Gammaproteobacteria bacterium]MBL6898596.1 N-acetylglutaminylglutamine amidotransferase [Gammaproteobacteria bacterium]